jgi:hypothetical protein
MVRLVRAIDREGGLDVAQGKADDEGACKYLMFLQNIVATRLWQGLFCVSAEIWRTARLLHHAGVCSMTPMPGLPILPCHRLCNFDPGPLLRYCHFAQALPDIPAPLALRVLLCAPHAPHIVALAL